MKSNQCVPLIVSIINKPFFLNRSPSYIIVHYSYIGVRNIQHFAENLSSPQRRCFHGCYNRVKLESATRLRLIWGGESTQAVGCHAELILKRHWAKPGAYKRENQWEYMPHVIGWHDRVLMRSCQERCTQTVLTRENDNITSLLHTVVCQISRNTYWHMELFPSFQVKIEIWSQTVWNTAFPHFDSTVRMIYGQWCLESLSIRDLFLTLGSEFRKYQR